MFSEFPLLLYQEWLFMKIDCFAFFFNPDQVLHISNFNCPNLKYLFWKRDWSLIPFKQWASLTGLTAASKFKPWLPAQWAVGTHRKDPSQMEKWLPEWTDQSEIGFDGYPVELPSQRWIMRSLDFYCCKTELAVEQIFALPAIWEKLRLMRHESNDEHFEDTKYCLSAFWSVRGSCVYGSKRTMHI